jgi:ATP-binding cassette subfamily A (ABC1) protein 1
MGYLRQLASLLRKNLLLKVRAPCEWATEVLLPIAFVGIMSALFFAFSTENLPDTNYVRLATSVEPFGSVPFRVLYRAQRIALVPASPAQKPLVDDFYATMKEWHPSFSFASLGSDSAWNDALVKNAPKSMAAGLGSLVVPGFADVVRNFSSNDDLTSYVTSGSYDSSWQTDSSSNPKIFAAFLFSSGANSGEAMEYSIRLNSSVTPSTDSSARVNFLGRGVFLSTIEKYIRTALVSTGPPFLSEKGDPISSKPFPGFVTFQREVDRWAIARKSSRARLPLSSMAPDQLVLAFASAVSQTLPIASNIVVSEIAATFQDLNSTNPSRVATLMLSISEWLASEFYPPQAVEFIPFPTAAYSFNTFYAFVLNILAFVLVIAFVFPNSRLIRGLVLEKETKMREGMRMMGLGDAALFGAHIFWYWFAYHLPVSLINAAICKATFFPASSYAVSFFIFFFFGTASTSMMYFLSSFFSRSKTASSMGIIVFIASYFPAFSFSATTTAGAKRLAALLPPTAFSLGLSNVGAFENNMAATQVNVVIDNWSFSDTLGMLIFDTFFYAFLGWYADQTLPASFGREFGVARPWYFLFTPSFWREAIGMPQPVQHTAPPVPVATRRGCWRRNSIESTTLPVSTDMSYFEGPDESQASLAASNRCVTVSNLVKDFDTPDGVKRAVNNVNLEMYEGQIFVLLGPNGAGKTTAISMMTGLLPPTAGRLTLFGKDLLTDTAEARASLGVCPQHDVLWPELTVQEHLEIFCAIKGVAPSLVASEVTKIIVDVGLTEKVNVFSSKLSGGMKRKLSVAIALIGGSKVVFLDEPTSGMDPYSRRSTWNILQNAREGRVILLTTHFMDEADILGDRIAIMGNGRVQCSGSPLFLKKKYGVGYVLILVKANANCRVDDTLSLIRAHIPEATIATNVAAEFNVRLPLSSSAAFPNMLSSLDSQLASLGLSSYGISVTSIEDVFLKIAEAQAIETAAAASHSLSAAYHASQGLLGGEPVKIEMPPVVRSFSASKGAGGVHPTAPASDEPASLESLRSLARVELSPLRAFFTHTYALLKKRSQYAYRDRRSQCYQILLPALLILLGLSLIQLGTSSTFIDFVFGLSDFNKASSRPPRVPHFDFKAGAGVDSPNIASMIGLMNKIAPSTETNIAFSIASAQTIPNANGWIVSPSSPAVDFERMSSLLIKDRLNYADSTYGAYVFPFSRGIVAQQNVSASPPFDAGLSASIFVNTTGYHTPGIFLNQLNSAVHKAYGGAGIVTHNWPLPKTKQEATLFASVFVFLASLIIIIAFSFVASNVALYIVREREVSAKHQQIISGVSISAYWVSNLIFDYFLFMVPAAIAIILLRLFGVQELINERQDRQAALVLNFFIFGFAMTLHTYILCFFFKNPSSAQSSILFINIFSVILVTASQFLSQLASTCQIEKGLRYVFPLLPSFSFGFNLLTLSFLDQLHLILATCDNLKNQKPFTSALDLKACGYQLLYLGIEAIVFSAVLLAIEFVNSKPSLRQYFFPDKDVPLSLGAEDDDVQREAARVDAAVTSGAVTDAITIHNLRKVYAGGKVAVRNLSYGVPTGEVFGFLGINGAGKTTTLQILSGDVLPTSGSAAMAGFDILNQQPQVRRLLGYCALLSGRALGVARDAYASRPASPPSRPPIRFSPRTPHCERAPRALRSHQGCLGAGPSQRCQL